MMLGDIRRCALLFDNHGNNIRPCYVKRSRRYQQTNARHHHRVIVTASSRIRRLRRSTMNSVDVFSILINNA